LIIVSIIVCKSHIAELSEELTTKALAFQVSLCSPQKSVTAITFARYSQLSSRASSYRWLSLSTSLKHPATNQNRPSPRYRQLVCYSPPHTSTTILPATRNLRQLHSEIAEVISTIHENIDHGRADLLVSLPELRKVMVELMDDSNQQVQLLVTEFGNHSLVREMQLDQVQLEEDAHDADMLIDLYTIDGDQDGVARWGTPSQLHSTAWVSSSSPQGSSCCLKRPFPNKHTQKGQCSLQDD
jgi:hypothetical protein